MYVLDVEASEDVITEYKQVKITRPYRILLKQRVNGRLSSKTFHFPTRKTLAKAVEHVNAERLALKEKFANEGTMREKKRNDKSEIGLHSTFETVWQDYHKAKSRNTRWSTAWAYEQDYNRNMQSLKHMLIKDIDESVLDEFIHAEKDRGYADATIIRVLASIKQVLTRAGHLVQWKRGDLGDTMKNLRPNRRSFTLTLEQVKPLIKAMKEHYESDIRDVFIWLLHGRRIGEVVNMRRDWINLENGTYTIPADYSKNKKELTFNLDQELIECVGRYKENISGHMYPINPPLVRKRFYKLQEQFEFDQIKLHSIRHLLGSLMYQQGVPIQNISRVLGHASIQTTMSRYITDSKDQASSALDSFDALLK